MVAEVKGTEKLESLVIEHIDTKERKEIQADLVVGAIGFLPSKTKFTNIDLKYKAGAITVDPVSLESAEVQGIFVAGDACHFDGKLKLICVGSAESAIAVNHIVKRLDSKASLKPVFSSNFFTEDFTKGK